MAQIHSTAIVDARAELDAGVEIGPYSEASIGKILFENGYKLASHLGLAGLTDRNAIAGRKAMLADLRALARRMERMRIEVLAAAEREEALEDMS